MNMMQPHELVSHGGGFWVHITFMFFQFWEASKTITNMVKWWSHLINDLFYWSSLCTIVIKQGCPLSPTLFGLCIDELDEMVVKFAKEEGIEEVAIENIVIMLLLYVNDIVLFANILGDECIKACEGILHVY